MITLFENAKWQDFLLLVHSSSGQVGRQARNGNDLCSSHRRLTPQARRDLITRNRTLSATYSRTNRSSPMDRRRAVAIGAVEMAESYHKQSVESATRRSVPSGRT